MKLCVRVCVCVYGFGDELELENMLLSFTFDAQKSLPC